MRRAGVGRDVETFTVPQNPPQASATRDSLAKGLYVRMFDMLVSKTNESFVRGLKKKWIFCVAMPPW